MPHFNVVNGGCHAPNSLDFQEFMIAPVGAPTMADAVRAGYGVYAKLRTLDWYQSLIEQFPIRSIEDGLAWRARRGPRIAGARI